MVQKSKKKHIKATRKKHRKTTKKGIFKTFLKYLIRFGLILFLILAAFLFYCYKTLPDIEVAFSKTRQPSTTVIAENGNEIQTFGNTFSHVVYLDELPSYVPAAIVDTEDRRFYAHFGFDIIGLTRALVQNILQKRYAEGASTITQQVAKNLFLTPQKSLKRKVQELFIALWLEHKFTKEQILTLYLNRVYLGAGVYGIEAAANKYFLKSSRDLNLKEVAVLAGLLKAPSRYNPIANKQKAIERATIVLNLMYQHGSITKEEYEKALKTPLEDITIYQVGGAHHFADMVYSEVNDYIGERDRDIYVSTTLDQDLQETAEKILRQSIKSHFKQNVQEGAVVILDYNGAIQALVGGINYERNQFNHATQALRQPGSAFKTFVYLTALQNGFEPSDIIEDKPIQISNWSPKNYNKKSYGKVSLDFAFSQSLNLATVYLSQKLDIDEIIQNAKRMGITTELKKIPSLSLGSCEVKVIDMAAAYLSIANGGFAAWPYAIREIYTKDGQQLYERISDESSQILDEETTEKMTNMLQNVIQNGTGKSALLPEFVAGKTGTSQDFRDAWFVGFTKKYVVAVWVGNDDNSAMKGISGGTLPAEIFKKIMLTTLN